jgi:hypothetical protein
MIERTKKLGWLLALAVVVTPVSLASAHDHELAGESITVYKSPTCGCCTKWIDHLKKHGYKVKIHDTDDMVSIKQSLGVPDSLGSCHTAVVGKYLIEGHVPASDIAALLKKKPKITGLAVPGMPSGSPGMENGRNDRYDVIAFTTGKKSSVFAKH